MLAAASSPVITYFLYGTQKQSLITFCIFAAVLVIYTHRSNLKRLKEGNENKFTFKPKTIVSE
jgi:glycerol-3-phosphate acyltransferase PlsY